jgi:hypothetical protein
MSSWIKETDAEHREAKFFLAKWTFFAGMLCLAVGLAIIVVAEWQLAAIFTSKIDRAASTGLGVVFFVLGLSVAFECERAIRRLQLP